MDPGLAAAVLREYARRFPQVVQRSEQTFKLPEGCREPLPSDSFPKQWAYVTSTAKLNALCASRRAGKTEAEILRKSRLLCRPGAIGHYVNLIRRNAKKQFWNKLVKYLARLGWVEGQHFEANWSDMILTTDWGSWVQALSCHDVSGVKAVRGDRSDDFTVDECQEPNDDVITGLVEAAEPMLTDTDGCMNLDGTPPEAEPCFFSEALDSQGWAHFYWTQFDHDHPRSREEKWATVKERCRKRNLPVNVIEGKDEQGRLTLELGTDEGGRIVGTHPVVSREIFGRRVKDPTKLAYEYMAGRNDYDPATVDFTPGDGRQWRHAGGLDIGFQDNDCIVIGAYNRKDDKRRLYARWGWLHNHLDYEDTKDVITVVVRVFGHMPWVGDYHGGGSLKIIESLRSRMRLLLGEKPKDVMISVGLVNDDYRTGRLLIHTDQEHLTRQLLEEVGRLDWDDMRKARVRRIIEAGAAAFDIAGDSGKVATSVNQRTRKKEINKKGFHSDATETGRYMHHAAWHFLARTPKVEPTADQKRTARILAKAARLRDPFGLKRRHVG